MENKNINTENIRHIAIIMDGNRRWAKAKGETQMFGHKNGAETLIKIAKYAKSIGIKYMTVYAFSKENWSRSKEEVNFLMKLLKTYAEDILKKTREELDNVKIKFIGNLEVVEKDIVKLIKDVENATENNNDFQLDVCFSYSGRQEIIDAIKNIISDINIDKFNINDLNESSFKNYLYDSSAPYPDLVIRTAGEMRLSNFLLWQIGYSEFYSTQKFWPEFSERDLDEAINSFNNRKRNNGK